MTRLWASGVAIQVELDEAGFPRCFVWNEHTHRTDTLLNRWRVDVHWWVFRVWREHYKLTTDTGLLVIIYRNLLDDCWYLQRLYD